MSTLFGTQLEPFEEIQSPSPKETTDNPYETSLARRSSSLHQRKGSGPPSPINTVNTLHRQLSGDPESPPPAWKRRSTVSSKHGRNPSAESVKPPQQQSPVQPSARSPSASSVNSRNSLQHVPSSRRHPGLTMTAAAIRPPAAVPNGMFLHESPNGSSTSLNDPDLALPNPAFRRRGNDSNRSSIASSQDLNSLTSEELWALNHDQEFPDMSNPMRQAAERPLDTVRRMSKRLERADQNYYGGLPGDVIWPAAPPTVEEILPASMKSKSFTNVASLGMANRRASKRGRSRQSSVDIIPGIAAKDNDGIYMHGQSVPGTPAQGKAVNGAISSAHSSSTSLASQGVATNKSFSSLSRPPSTYYSRDFLSSLAPREGGYAIAAQMGGGLGAHGTMSVEEKRRTSVLDDPRSKTMGSRAPLSKSAGMGRWSLDGGENYGRPYTTASAATTSSNLTAPPINSAEPSPSADESSPTLPDGASPAFIVAPNASASSHASPTPPAGSAPASTTPPNPSPLSQRAPAQGIAGPPVSAIPPPPPIPVSNVVPPPTLNTKKSKKQLAKDAKAAEKAEAVKVARVRAEQARAETLKKQQEKEDAKRKEKEEKARRKAEKHAAKSNKSAPAAATAAAARTAPPVQPIPVPAPTGPAPSNWTTPPTSGTQPFPRPLQSSQSAYKVPTRDATEPPRKTHQSMPLNTIAPAPASTTTSASASTSRPPTQPKRTLLGTIRKKLSHLAGSSESKGNEQTDVPPVPKIDPKKVAEAQSLPIPTTPQRQAQAQSQPQTSTLPSYTPGSPELAERPPRRESLLASPTASKVTALPPAEVPSSNSEPEVLNGLEKHPNGDASQQTQAPESHSAGPVLAQPIAHTPGSPRTSSPATSPRKRNSIVGPRPMPEGKSRPSSIAASSSDHAHVHAQSPSHSQTQSYPYHSERGPVPVTPSTSGDSTSYVQSHASHMTGITAVTSQSDTEGASRKSIDGGISLEDGPVREGSKDSNETVHKPASTGFDAPSQTIAAV